MIKSEINDYLSFCQSSGLVWDKFKEAAKCSPEEFETMFRKYHSPVVCRLLFSEDNDSALHVTSGINWIAVTVEWRFKNPITKSKE